MSQFAPIYTKENCHFAYQLNWGLSVFWQEPTLEDCWLKDLAKATEPDEIRVLKHRYIEPGVSQFLVSTTPNVAPKLLVARIKGRLQYLVRDRLPKALKRNYDLHSIGRSTRTVVERYVESQLERCHMADPAVQELLHRLQIRRCQIDLSQPQRTVRGIFRYNLHLVLETEEGWHDVSEQRLTKVRNMILAAADAKGHLLSRAGLLPDHIHLTLGCPFEVPPADIALGYLNNLAYAYGMTPVFRFSAYIGTFGEYDAGTPGERTPWPGA